MIEGARWRRWVYFYLPMTFFLLFLLFVRVLPAISIYEMRELLSERGENKA